MEISDANKLKTELEKEIEDKLNAFEKQTGLKVSSVDFTRKDYISGELGDIACLTLLAQL